MDRQRGISGAFMGWWRPRRRRRVGWAGRATDRVTTRIAEVGSRIGGGPRPDFRAKLRADLLEAHAAERRPAERPPAERPEVRRPSLLVRLRPAVVFTMLLGVMFLTGSRAYDSVPGDMLYPLKRAAEATVLRLATSDTELAKREMAAARLRAAEAATLAGAPGPGRDELITQALDDMARTTRAALARVRPRDDKPDGEVRRFAREQRTMVEPLLPKLDRENRDKATKYLTYIDTFTSPVE
ncbi:hypothetical protein IMZ11_13475 [Microtetraspora sp. AC03309]|uniref:DUF5667 domain-containing protein n=1 Tax=Microtetraspora sp. AC03309 TaxID=2779376 RepID=UPI001E554A53|nr:DUF5667 domain-containing protein [Microtetraspora sp. AC03309]MCC5576641.1 hypothetical protein [Microtetraspora sp. AC03309]